MMRGPTSGRAGSAGEPSETRERGSRVRRESYCDDRHPGLGPRRPDTGPGLPTSRPSGDDRLSPSEALQGWVRDATPDVCLGTLTETARFGEVVVLSVLGTAAEEVVIRLAGPENLSGKVLLDASDPLDFSGRPGLFVGTTDSLGERIQRAAPRALVVKGLNIVLAEVMVDPHRTGGEPDMSIAGVRRDGEGDRCRSAGRVRLAGDRPRRDRERPLARGNEPRLGRLLPPHGTDPPCVQARRQVAVPPGTAIARARPALQIRSGTPDPFRHPRSVPALQIRSGTADPSGCCRFYRR